MTNGILQPLHPCYAFPAGYLFRKVSPMEMNALFFPDQAIRRVIVFHFIHGGNSPVNHYCLLYGA